MRVTGTGDAHAEDGGNAVSGYRGPAPGSSSGTAPASPVQEVSGTGDATATGPGATAISGNMTVVHQHRGPREPAPWPHQIGTIPPRARPFQRRTEADLLRMTAGGGATAVPGQVLTGMGGVGKTQIAADHARRAWQDGSVDVLVWVTASDRSPVVSSYAQAGVELCRADPEAPDEAAAAFLAWLTPKAAARPCRWLVVLDDVADPDDLRGLWPPDSPYGHTLVTTRRRDAALTGAGRHLVPVGLFTPDEAVTYLAASLHAHHRTEAADRLAALARDLGHLPLALSQAAAYLVDSGDDVAAYREQLADRATTLADAAPDRLPDDQPVALAAAWSLSVDRADTLRPVGLARPMLRLTALLDPNGIPETVLTSDPARTHLAAHRTPTGQDPAGEPDPVTPREATLALRALHRLSLIDHTPGTPHQAVRVHQLVQRAVRDTLTLGQHDHLARAAADALLAAWPDNEYGTALAQALRANTAVLAGHSEQALYQPEAHKVLYEAGGSLGGVGQATAARDYFGRLAQTVARYLGPDSYFTLGARNNSAEWQGWAGDVEGAAAAFAELLDDMVRILGHDHPDTLIVRSNLAHFRGEAGDVEGAAAAFAELLDDSLRVLGPDHPSTLIFRHNLASRRKEAGDVEGATAAFAELLDDMVRVLGHDHHADTLAVRHNLAYLQLEAGDMAAAAAAFAELLDDSLRVLGPDHPNTLTIRHNLAKSRGEAGDTEGAVAAFAELLEDSVRVLGPDHPDTFIARNDLAYFRGEAGDAEGAAAAFAELLDDIVRVLGPDHPSTRTAQNNLARWQGMLRTDEDTPDAG
ncbi:FxSxx-COOH system tetratricopeptide repeat protein [Streptomyces sp. NPDC087270]|uniref:FxSxx-COOH system tetratricopeptide repeat protein n=1 Tax=Streptomyces sp. NPDC087270 TaxID=3365774 RepID=UPI0037FA1F23